MFVIFFTLPVIASQFGMVSLLSPFANIILVPIFSLLIYLAPLVLITCDIPFLGDFIIFITEKITDGALFIVSSFSKIERAMLPIRNITQIIGVTVVSVSMVAILFLSKKHLKKIFISSLVGAFIIFLGSCQLFIERGNSSYVGIYSFTGNDLVFYEENNTLTIVDITKCTKTSASRSRNLASYLGYSEIENYVITSFSENAIIHLNRLLNQTKIKHLYLPTPNTDTEIRLYYKIVELVISKDVIPKSINDEISILNSKMSFEITYHERSIRKSVSMLLEKGGTYFAYMSSGSFEVDSDFCKNSAALSSYLIFGSFGPSNRVTIDYEVPNLQYCAFLGDTPSYISTDFVIKNAKKTLLYEKEPLKFTLP